MFFSFPLSLTLQSTVSQHPPATGLCRAEESWVVQPRRGRCQGHSSLLVFAHQFLPVSASEGQPCSATRAVTLSLSLLAGARAHHHHRDRDSPWQEPPGSAGTPRSPEHRVAPEHPQLRHQPGSAPLGREEKGAERDKRAQFSLGARAKICKPHGTPRGWQREKENWEMRDLGEQRQPWNRRDLPPA